MIGNLARNATIALISLLIVATFILILGIGLITVEMNEMQLTVADQQKAQTSMLADTCLEEAAFQLKRNPGYTDGTLNIDSGRCNIHITADGVRRTATIIADSNNFTKRYQAIFIITTNGRSTNINLDSWREI